MTTWMRTLLIRTPLVALLMAAALSTPALARPSTPCDETAQGCQGLSSDDEQGFDRDASKVIENKPTRPNGDDDDDDGGADIGGL